MANHPTTWPSPYDRVVTKSKKKFSGTIIHSIRKEKENKKFFHRHFYFLTLTFFWKSGLLDSFFGKPPNHLILAVWPCGHEIEKEIFWDHYSFNSKGKSKQKFFSSTFLFSHTNVFLKIWTFGPIFWQTTHLLDPRRMTVWSRNRKRNFLAPLFIQFERKNKTKIFFIDFFILSH